MSLTPKPLPRLCQLSAVQDSQKLAERVNRLLDQRGVAPMGDDQEWTLAVAASLRAARDNFKWLIGGLVIFVPAVVVWAAGGGGYGPPFAALIGGGLALKAAIEIYKDRGASEAAAGILEHRSKLS